MVKQFGPPEVLQPAEVPDPVAGAGEVVIAVAVADVLWVETMIRNTGGDPTFGVTPPYVPGGAVVGTVREVGAGVDPGWIGRTVVGRSGFSGGGYAERFVAAEAGLSVVPDGLDVQVAAAVVHDGVTALALSELTAVDRAGSVLVVGASGGLGIASVQLALAAGARVVAIARDRRKLARIRELGASAVIGSEAPDWIEQARTALGGDGADVVLDNIGGAVGEAAFDLTAPGGRFSAHGTPGGRFASIDPAVAAARGVTVSGIADVQLSPERLKELTERALADAAAGRLAPVIGQTFPLAKAADAHAAIESRTVFGKTLLII